jgi:hypothetical protein
MASKIEIINRALTLIGMQPIASITDDTEQAKIANRIYDLTLDGLLSECLWAFASKRVLLALVDSPIAWNDIGMSLAFAYQYPNDCIRIFKTSDPKAIWYQEGDVIYSNTEGLGIKYVYRMTDASKYFVKFSTALADKLAYEFSFTFMNASTTTEKLLAKYQEVSLPDAITENSQIGTPQAIIDDEWLIAKYGDVI